GGGNGAARRVVRRGRGAGRHRIVLLRVPRGGRRVGRRRRRRLPRAVRRPVPLGRRRRARGRPGDRHGPVLGVAQAQASAEVSDPVIEVRDLSFRYPGAERDTLRNVDLTIERGDFVAIVGGNGSGKTTLCKTFNGL